MSRRRESSSHIRKINKKNKYTYYVTIPKEDIDALGWRDKQKVIVRREGDELSIKDWKPKRKQ